MDDKKKKKKKSYSVFIIKECNVQITYELIDFIWVTSYWYQFLLLSFEWLVCINSLLSLEVVDLYCVFQLVVDPYMLL
jgi:hypothetical protein